MKIIKRYQNRKLYDTETSSYVTLEDIAEMVKRGQEIQVVDNKTKEDLTAVILSQILFEEQKKQKSRLPLGLLKRMIQFPAESLHEFFEYLSTNVQGVGHLKEEADRYLQKRRRGGEAPPQGEEELHPSLGEFLSVPQRNLDLLQKKIDERFRLAFAKISGLDELREEMETLRADLARLEARLDHLEDRLPAPRAKDTRREDPEG
ncbi:MAG: transcriptional regulator [Deltaproteobacteria bacterium]|nr:MAG: transcriptional regulator [Deltaproteobacteria bacterium]